MVVTEETELLEQNKKNRGNKRGRFNKGKVKELIKQEDITETSENVLPQNAEIELSVEPKEVVVEETSTETPEVEQAEPQKKTRRPNRGQGKSRTRRAPKSKKGEDEE